MTFEYWQIIFAGMVAVSTLIYAIFTIFLVNENILLRKVQTEPEIIVYIQIPEDQPSIFEIVVRNIGGGTAYNIRWKFDQNAILAKDRGSRLNKQNFFINGVDYFAPGQVYHSMFGNGPLLLKKPAPPSLLLRVSYENRQQKKYHREYNIDPMQFYGSSRISGQELRDIAESLRDIKNIIGHMVSQIGRLNWKISDSEGHTQEYKKRKIFSIGKEKPKIKKKS
jgi:hypothetical protein